GENQRAVEFIGEFTPWHLALMGPRGDCYLPEAALGREEARRFHEWQAGELRGARGVLLSTFPAVSEVLGILDVLEAPAVVSFVLTEEGRLLDGTPLERAMEELDDAAGRRPVGYWVNCTHAGRALDGLRTVVGRGELRRLIGVQANSSRLDPREFAGATEFDGDGPAEFAEGLLALRQEFGVRVLGGCCGTRAEHLEALAKALAGDATRR
ncbi:MAG: homocysteine S-methyltransferase family protein, partial [Acidobacteria bacterium]|nr:homocysteine S-methyltransferase family protein [Acidobacteriota bacterium]